MSRVADLAAVLERAGIGPDYDPAQLSAALERARVVGVLDEWAFTGARGWSTRKDDVTYGCGLKGNDQAVFRWFTGDSPDAARAAAAKAIEAGGV